LLPFPGWFSLRPFFYNNDRPITPLHKSPDMLHVRHKLVKSTLPSPIVPPNYRRAEKQAVTLHPGWLDLSLKRVLSVEFVELSPFTKQGEAPFAKSVDLLHFLLARGPGPGTYAN
jgi:hypothetical protein